MQNILRIGVQYFIIIIIIYTSVPKKTGGVHNSVNICKIQATTCL